MKALTIALIATAVAATPASAFQYKIDGTLSGHDGEKIYIANLDKQKIDSAVITDGKFSFSGELPSVQQAFLQLGRTNSLFMLSDHPVTVEAYDRVRESPKGNRMVTVMKFSGDPDQQILAKLNDAIGQEGLMMLGLAFSSSDTTMTKEQSDEVVRMFVKAKEYKAMVIDSIVTNCKDSYVAPMVMLDHLSKEISAAKMDSIFQTLDPNIRQSSIGREVAAKINLMNGVSVGSIAPDFTMPTPNGGQLSLSEALKGKKALLIDFWASWCGPCLREAPNIRNVYGKYKDKGFEVLSVSIDNDGQAWRDAIKNHNLPWLHVSSLEGWESPVAKLYNVTGVPAMFLLDSEGRIVSDNARGEQLEIEVAKLCN